MKIKAYHLISLLCILCIGCAKTFVSKTEEPTYQSEVIGTSLALEKTYSGTMLNLQLGEQQKVREHYITIEKYKRKSWIGFLTACAGVGIGCVLYPLDKPDLPEVPSGGTEFVEQWKIDNNYAGQMTDYYTKSSVYESNLSKFKIFAWSAVLSGVAVHLLTNKSVTEKKIKTKDILNNKIISKTAVDIYINDKLSYKANTDINGRLNVDLSEFIDNAKDNEFVFSFPEYSYFADTLTIPASYMEKLYVERKDKEKEQEKRAYAEKVEKLINTELFKVLSFGMTLKEARKAIRDAIWPDTKDFVGIGYYFDNDSCIVSGAFYENKLHTKNLSYGKNDAPDRFIKYFQKFEKLYGLPIDHVSINTNDLNRRSNLYFKYPCEATAGIWEFSENGKRTRITLVLCMSTDLFKYNKLDIHITDIERENHVKEHYPPHNAYDVAFYDIGVYQVVRAWR